MTYRIAICDDNKEYLELLETRVQNYCDSHTVGILIKSFEDSDLLLEHIEEQKMYDVYILDIEMPKYSGIELAKKIKESTKCAIIIFLTAHERHAIEGYELGLFRYILKEQLDDRLDDTLTELFIRLSQSQYDKEYTINNQRKYIKLYQKEISYIYKNEKSTIIVLQDMTEVYQRSTLQEVYRKMENPDLFFLDRGTIINLRHIQEIIKGQIVMDNGKILKTAKANLSTLKKYLNSYWISEL